MSRFCNWMWFSVVGISLGIGPSSAQASRPSEQLLPETTAGFTAIANVNDLADHWDQTQLGQLMADPVMEPFAMDLRRQFENRWSGVHQRLGLTLDDLKGVPGGEVGFALILQPAPDDNADKNLEDKACLAIIVDVTGHLPQANDLLEKVSDNLKKAAADRSELNVPESSVPVVQFDHLPKPKDNPLADPGKAFYCLSGNLLIASDNLQEIRAILARMALPPGQGESLADVPGFQEAMRRCSQDNGGAIPQIRWFIHPLTYVGAIRAATPEKYRRKGKSVLEILRNQGLGVIQGVGGFVDFRLDTYEVIHRTYVFAPRPYHESMKMLVFPPGTNFEPQRWVPRDVATYTTFYFDILNAFDNFGALFNEMVGGPVFLFRAGVDCQADLDKGVLPETFREEFQQFEPPISPEVTITAKKPGSVWELKGKDSQGRDEVCTVKKSGLALNVYLKEDYWRQVLEGLNDPEDPLSPQIDLREELISHLGQRVTVITAYESPITTTSERLLFAIETTNEEAVKAAIEKTMKTNEDVKPSAYEGHVIWENVEQEQSGKTEVPTITIPSLTGEDEPVEGEEEEVQDKRLLPHSAVTVAYGHLFVASHIDFLKEALKPRQPRNMLGANVDWKLVQAELDRLKIAGKCAMVFSRTDEEYRPTYELIRQGKMPQGETMLARLLNGLFATGKKGEFRHQKIDGSQMPEFDVVRRYLGAAGMAVSSELNGWFFKGFTLKK